MLNLLLLFFTLNIHESVDCYDLQALERQQENDDNWESHSSESCLLNL